MVLLLPRISSVAAEQLLDDFLGSTNKSLDTFDPNSLPKGLTFGASGGSLATGNQLKQLHDGIVKIASSCGYERTDIASNFSLFDASTAELLADSQMFNSGEALKDEVWACIATVILPHVVFWRFGDSRERYLGGVRNTFQRLWLRGRILDLGAQSTDRWSLLRELTEDAFVQIVERPSIGADSKIAVALAQGWVRASMRFGKSSMEDIMRRTTLVVRMHNEVRSLSSMSDENLEDYVNRTFDNAASKVNKSNEVPNMPRSKDQTTTSFTNDGTIEPASKTTPVLSPSKQRKRRWAIWPAK